MEAMATEQLGKVIHDITPYVQKIQSFFAILAVHPYWDI